MTKGAIATSSFTIAGLLGVITATGASISSVVGVGAGAYDHANK